MMKRIGELKAENERLRMEQRLKAVPVEAKLFDRIAELKAKVERLTKAGDAMATGLQGMAGERPKALADEWHDAKEGMQS
jgi:phage host-nuclease inhibitor protein Gam